MLTPEQRPYEVARLTATILNGQSVSDVQDLGGLHLAAIAMPAAWTAAGITLQTSFDGVTWYDVQANGIELLLPAAASQYVVLDFTTTIALGPLVKIRSGTLGTPVNQGAARGLILVPRSF